MEKKMYVIVNKQLSPIYKMVQGGHALAKFALDYPIEFKEWNNQYLIYVEVSFNELEMIRDNLHIIPHSCWIEPDIRQITAICIPENFGFWCKFLPLASL